MANTTFDPLPIFFPFKSLYCPNIRLENYSTNLSIEKWQYYPSSFFCSMSIPCSNFKSSWWPQVTRRVPVNITLITTNYHFFPKFSFISTKQSKCIFIFYHSTFLLLQPNTHQRNYKSFISLTFLSSLLFNNMIKSC